MKIEKQGNQTVITCSNHHFGLIKQVMQQFLDDTLAEQRRHNPFANLTLRPDWYSLLEDFKIIKG